jgi:hypothetical protein
MDNLDNIVSSNKSNSWGSARKALAFAATAALLGASYLGIGTGKASAQEKQKRDNKSYVLSKPDTTRIAPYGAISDLHAEHGVLEAPIKLMPASYTDSNAIVIDFNKFPITNDEGNNENANAMITVKPLTLEQALRSDTLRIKNAKILDKKTGKKIPLYNKQTIRQKIKNAWEFYHRNKNHATNDTNWTNALKDAKVLQSEFESIKPGLHAYEITAKDRSTGKNLASMIGYAEKDSSYAKPDTVRVRENVETPNARQGFTLGVGAQHSGDHNRFAPEVMIGYDGIPILGTELDINAGYGQMAPYTQKGTDIVFPGPFGKTTEFHDNRKYHEFANVAVFLGKGFSLGGIVQYNRDKDADENPSVDQMILDRNNNERHMPGRTKPTKWDQEEYFSGGPAAKIHLGDGWKITIGSEYAKGHKPAYLTRFSKTF